jgi:hypothetical protein
LCESVLSTIAHSVQEEEGKLTKQQLNQSFLMGGQHLPHLTFLIFLLPIKDSTSKCFLIKTILLKFTNSLFSFNNCYGFAKWHYFCHTINMNLLCCVCSYFQMKLPQNATE